MQVVSRPIGRARVHFEAPGHERLKGKMTAFLKWFNAPGEMDLVLKSALAHFWFVTIHPFEDGNGRIARAIADLLLARSEKTAQRFYSMSSQIQQERNAAAQQCATCCNTRRAFTNSATTCNNAPLRCGEQDVAVQILSLRPFSLSGPDRAKDLWRRLDSNRELGAAGGGAHGSPVHPINRV
jgi:prophage maintenance system killer protein